MRINKLVSTIMLIIITAVFIFLFVIPKYKELSSMASSLAQKQADYDSKSVYYTGISELTKKIESRKEDLVKIDSALPSDFYLSSSVNYFQEKAAKNGLIVKSATLSQVSSATKDSAVRNVVFSLHLNGSYEGFKEFLASLDTSARLFEVNSISFSTATLVEDKKDPKIKISTYDFSMEVLTHAY